MSTRTQLMSRSKAQQRVEHALAAVYQQMAAEGVPVCAGCGTTQHLSHSHLVPRSYNKKLICEPANIVYHCLDWGGRVGCHTKWESNARRTELRSFAQHLATVRRLDPQYYALLQLKTHNLA